MNVINLAKNTLVNCCLSVGCALLISITLQFRQWFLPIDASSESFFVMVAWLLCGLLTTIRMRTLSSAMAVEILLDQIMELRAERNAQREIIRRMALNKEVDDILNDILAKDNPTRILEL